MFMQKCCLLLRQRIALLNPEGFFPLAFDLSPLSCLLYPCVFNLCGKNRNPDIPPITILIIVPDRTIIMDVLSDGIELI
jgi:hypothetical protein